MERINLFRVRRQYKAIYLSLRSRPNIIDGHRKNMWTCIRKSQSRPIALSIMYSIRNGDTVEVICFRKADISHGKQHYSSQKSQHLFHHLSPMRFIPHVNGYRKNLQSFGRTQQRKILPSHSFEPMRFEVPVSHYAFCMSVFLALYSRQKLAENFIHKIK